MSRTPRRARRGTSSRLCVAGQSERVRTATASRATNQVSRTSLVVGCQSPRRLGDEPMRLVLGLGDEHVAVARPIPSRNPVPPPQLAADAPRLDVLHPVEEGLLPASWGRSRSARRAPPASARWASFSASTYHWSVSHGSITTPPRSPNGVGDRARLGVVLLAVLVDVRDEEALLLHAARPPARAPRSGRGRGTRPGSARRRSAPPCASASNMLSISPGLKPGALAHFEVVEVVPRGDLHRAASPARDRRARRRRS